MALMTMFHNLLGSESMQLKIVNLLSDRELLSGIVIFSFQYLELNRISGVQFLCTSPLKRKFKRDLFRRL